MKQKKEESEPQRGGKREGAGRPMARPTVAAPFRIYADTAVKFKALAVAKEMSSAELFETMFNALV